MLNKKLLISILIICVSIIATYLFNNPFIALEYEKCPFCYGTNFCAEFQNNVTFSKLTIFEKLSNFFNPKNVFYAHLNGKKIVLKKLGHNWELENVDKIICKYLNGSENCLTNINGQNLTVNIIELLKTVNENEPPNLKICTTDAIVKFVNILTRFDLKTEVIWTTLLTNAEPLLIQILNPDDGWPIPEYYGACGRLIAEEYCGPTLNAISDAPWLIRAKVALDLLWAAKNFTDKHPMFRFYFTDVSPDNIVVTEHQQVRFVDLENVIIAAKNSSNANKKLHETQQFDCGNCYAFSTEDICRQEISDHNYYSTCKFLLSKNSPWPMMENGLLHSPPAHISQNYPILYDTIEACADLNTRLNRLETTDQLINMLTTIVRNENSVVGK